VAYSVEQNKSIAAAGRKLETGESTLANWRSAEVRNAGGGPVRPAERGELRRLRAENPELHMRVELLKEATAFFASETQN
jgi:transposase-like protein